MHTIKIKTCFFVAAAAVVLSAGCSFDDKLAVTGKVTFDGAPVESGEIIFSDPTGEKQSNATTITGGEYSLPVSSGSKLVRISAFRETGKIDRSNPGVETAAKEMYIPEKYNSKSTLNVMVDSSQTTHDFALEK